MENDELARRVQYLERKQERAEAEIDTLRSAMAERDLREAQKEASQWRWGVTALGAVVMAMASWIASYLDLTHLFNPRSGP